jgi:CheY-like chemotaxis protein
MAQSRTLNLLLAEDNLEDEHLLREALVEIEDNGLWGRWSTCNLTQVDRLNDTLECLQLAQFDAILLNLTLPDNASLLDTFLRVQAAAPGAPLVVLCDEDDPALAARLIREGAQDVIVKSEIECLPLARAIRHGIERSRRLATLEARVFLDPLTGVQNRYGFLQLGGHYLLLARRTGATASFLLIQFEADASEDLDPLLIRATEVSRVIFPDGTLIGRLQAATLGFLAVGVGAQEAEALADRLRHDLHSAFPDAPQPQFVVIEADAKRWLNVEDLLDAPRLAGRIPVSCQVGHRAGCDL